MKYNVEYSCGHKGTVELFGPTKDRESKIEWYEHEHYAQNVIKKEWKKRKRKWVWLPM